MAQKYSQELELDYEELTSSTKQQRKQKVTNAITNQMVEELKNKHLHGQYSKLLDEPHIDKSKSTKWLTSPSLKASTESTISAIQEQAITTNYIKKHIFKSETSDLCRVCRTAKETIFHVISSCEALAPTKYLQRHDNLCKYVHILLLKEYGFVNKITPWYQHQPKNVEENDKAKILWNFTIQTDHHLRHIKPDILVIDKSKSEANIIDIAIPSDYNLAQKRLEKIRNYSNLAVEIKTLWTLTKVRITPIIIGAMGTIYKDIDKDIGKLELKNTKFDIFEGQKIAILGTTHIVRSFMQIA